MRAGFAAAHAVRRTGTYPLPGAVECPAVVESAVAVETLDALDDFAVFVRQLPRINHAVAVRVLAVAALATLERHAHLVDPAVARTQSYPRASPQ